MHCSTPYGTRNHSNVSSLIIESDTNEVKNETTRKRHQLPMWRIALALAAGGCQHFLCWGLIMTYGVIISYYEQRLLRGSSETVLVIAGAIPPFLAHGLALLWGRLLDAGHHRSLSIFAGICLTGGLTALAFTANEHVTPPRGRIWQIMLASVPIGIGQGVYLLSAPHIAKTWWPERKGLAMGITNSGAALGGTVWPFVFESMTVRYGFRLGVGTLALASIFLAAFIVVFAGPAPTFQRRSISFEQSSTKRWIPIRAFRSKTYVIHMAAMCFIYGGILTVPFLTVKWAQHKDIGIGTRPKDGQHISIIRGGRLRVYLVIVMNAAQLPGRLLGASLCDYFSARTLHAIVCVFAALLISTFWTLTTSFSTACVFTTLFGATLGFIAAFPMNDVIELLGRKRQRFVGQYGGVMYTLASPFILVGVIIGGLLADHVSVIMSGVWAACLFAIGAVLIGLSFLVDNDTWKLGSDREDCSWDNNCDTTTNVTATDAEQASRIELGSKEEREPQE